MDQPNTTIPSAPVKLSQVAPNLENEIPTTNRKPYFLFLFIFLILCITLFIFWASYRIYQIKKQSKNPDPSPATEIANTVDAIDNATKLEGVYACAPQNGGICAFYSIVNIEEICPITFKTENCDNQCGNPVNLCK